MHGWWRMESKKLSPKRGNQEAKLQVAFINWMEYALPDVTVWHNYQENAKNVIQGKIKKDRGVLAGVHDNCLMWSGHNFATIELKSPMKAASQNKYSPSQVEFALKMDAAGFPHACCQNGAQIEAAIKAFGLKPLYRFPLALQSSGRQMLQQAVMDAMYKND